MLSLFYLTNVVANSRSYFFQTRVSGCLVYYGF